jgi:hypothetical protein
MAGFGRKEKAVATAGDYGLARRMWHQLEPIHAVFWYAPEAVEEAAALGYDTSARSGMKSNGAPTGWPTPPGRRWAQAGQRGSPSLPPRYSAPPSNPACSPRSPLWASRPCRPPPHDPSSLIRSGIDPERDVLSIADDQRQPHAPGA